jgi:hypothetical protein
MEEPGGRRSLTGGPHAIVKAGEGREDDSWIRANLRIIPGFSTVEKSLMVLSDEIKFLLPSKISLNFCGGTRYQDEQLSLLV